MNASGLSRSWAYALAGRPGARFVREAATLLVGKVTIKKGHPGQEGTTKHPFAGAAP